MWSTVALAVAPFFSVATGASGLKIEPALLEALQQPSQHNRVISSSEEANLCEDGIACPDVMADIANTRLMEVANSSPAALAYLNLLSPLHVLALEPSLSTTTWSMLRRRVSTPSGALVKRRKQPTPNEKIEIAFWQKPGQKDDQPTQRQSPTFLRSFFVRYLDFAQAFWFKA
jgi:hypothetical protein